MQLHHAAVIVLPTACVRWLFPNVCKTSMASLSHVYSSSSVLTYDNDSRDVIDVLIPHFLPTNVARHRVIQQHPHRVLRLHIFTIHEVNDSVCYVNPITHINKCVPRLHLTAQALSLKSKNAHTTSYQVTLDFLVGT